MHIVVYGGCVPRKSLGAGAVGGRARVVARERRVILLLCVACVAFGRCERCDDVSCLLVVTRGKFVIVTFFYTVSGSIFQARQSKGKKTVRCGTGYDGGKHDWRSYVCSVSRAGTDEVRVGSNTVEDGIRANHHHADGRRRFDGSERYATRDTQSGETE